MILVEMLAIICSSYITYQDPRMYQQCKTYYQQCIQTMAQKEKWKDAGFNEVQLGMFLIISKDRALDTCLRETK